MERSLSNRDIVAALRGRINLMTHEELTGLGLEQLLGLKYPLVLLYEHSKNYGHWVVLLQTQLADGRLAYELFDSYGLLPDDQPTKKAGAALDDPDYRAALTRLLIGLTDLGVPVSYNHFPLQENAEGINTCGRWVLARVLFRHRPLEVFAEMFPDDEMVTAFTEEFLRL